MAHTLRRDLWTAIFGGALATLVAASACSPLPGRSLDPLYVEGDPGPRPSTPEAPPPAPAAVARGAEPARVWVGRYRDSRGAGDVTFTLVRGATTVSGTWQLRTGGGGPVTALAEARARRFQLRMENTAPECPGTFEGSAEITDTTLAATYRGSDCEGPVSDGHLELRVR